MKRHRYPPPHLFIGVWGMTGILFCDCLVCGKCVNAGCRMPGPGRWLRNFVRFLHRHRHCGFK
jgi:hypothetical protein